MPKDLLRALNLLSKTVQVGRTQVDDHIDYVEQVCKEVKEGVGWVEDRLVHFDSHWNEYD